MDTEFLKKTGYNWKIRSYVGIIYDTNKIHSRFASGLRDITDSMKIHFTPFHKQRNSSSMGVSVGTVLVI